MQSIPRHDEPAADSGSRRIRRIARGFFSATFGLVVLKEALAVPALQHTAWPAAFLIIAATFSILESWSQQVPWQNALLAAAIIGLAGGFIQMIGSLTGLPLGPFFHAQSAGPHLFGRPAALAVAWILSLLASRGVAQLVLRPWRQTSSYGLWQLVLSASLGLMFYFNLESFALREDGHWIWRSTAATATGNILVKPLLHCAAWCATALLLLAIATPALLKKRPVQPPPTLNPLIVWTFLNVLFATSTFRSQDLWPVAAACLGSVAVVFLLALRGTRL